MGNRTQITLDLETQRRAQAKAAELGISFAEYIRRIIAKDLGESKPKFDVSKLFNYVKGGPATNIARDKDKMIGEAVWEEHLRSVGRRPKRKPQSKTAA